MIVESTENSELAQDSGEQDAVMAALLAKEEAPAEQQEAVEGQEAQEEQAADAEEQEAQDPAEQQDDDPEIDFGDFKLKKSEAKAGYMKDADYRRKTAEVAEAKR